MMAVIALFSICVALLAAGEDQSKAESEWTAAAGKQDYYKKIKGDEVILKGTYVAEYYGKPGHHYIQAPYNYYLKTKDGNVSLIYLQNFHLDKCEVELKGKIKLGKDNTKHMYVGWYRTITKSDDKPNVKGKE